MTPSSAENPFTPGYGKVPPHLAGRAEAQDTLRRDLLTTARGGTPSSDVVIYGPRGTGKTVLLKWAATEVDRLDPQARTLELSDTHFQDRDAVLRWFLAERPGWTRRLTPQTIEANLPLLGAKWDSSARSGDFTLHDVVVAQCRRRPLIALIDEVHNLSPVICHELLNEAQTLRRRGAPLLLLLAGTPGIQDVLRAAGSTFWERGELVSLGLLSPEAARDAIRVPFGRGGRTISPAALDAVVEDSQGYPWFLQLWGRVLWDRATASGPEGGIDTVDVEAAQEVVSVRRQELYASRYERWDDRTMECLAEALSRRRPPNRLTPQSLRNGIREAARDQGRTDVDAGGIVREVIASDLLWRPLGSSSLVPGTPSFLNYVLERNGHPPPPRPS